MRISFGKSSEVDYVPREHSHHHEEYTLSHQHHNLPQTKAQEGSIEQVSAKRIPLYAQQGVGIAPRQYFSFLKNSRAVWTPRFKAVGTWTVMGAFFAWYALKPHSTEILRRIYTGEVPDE